MSNTPNTAKVARKARPVLLASAAVLALGIAPATGYAEEITTSHGFSFLGTLKYPADFPHLDYVNVNAPKGGEMAAYVHNTHYESSIFHF